MGLPNATRCARVTDGQENKRVRKAQGLGIFLSFGGGRLSMAGSERSASSEPAEGLVVALWSESVGFGGVGWGFCGGTGLDLSDGLAMSTPKDWNGNHEGA